jgi:hypothetical protein
MKFGNSDINKMSKNLRICGIWLGMKKHEQFAESFDEGIEPN